jgi:hypothetical protein
MPIGMETRDRNVVNNSEFTPSWQRERHVATRPCYLHLVTACDLQDLSEALAKQQLPPDLKIKLSRLAVHELSHRFIEQNCRTIIALLQAVEEGSFKEASPKDCERLLRVLAYVRKDDDAIPDYRPDGFIDDQQEVRTVTTDLDHLLRTFKAWRLRHQVPGMWLHRSQCVWPETDSRLGFASQAGDAKVQNGQRLYSARLSK